MFVNDRGLPGNQAWAPLLPPRATRTSFFCVQLPASCPPQAGRAGHRKRVVLFCFYLKREHQAWPSKPDSLTSDPEHGLGGLGVGVMVKMCYYSSNSGHLFHAGPAWWFFCCSSLKACCVSQAVLGAGDRATNTVVKSVFIFLSSGKGREEKHGNNSHALHSDVVSV